MAMPGPQLSALPTRRGLKAPEAWSFTASTGPHDDDGALVVYHVAVSNLGIEDLTRELGVTWSPAEALRWQRARVREYVMCLREQLRLHVGGAELIVHAEEGRVPDRVQVITTATVAAHDAARLEQELADRVEAIATRVWAGWIEGLRLTMATLQSLEDRPAP